MAVQKIPYSTLLQDYGATHRWPLTGSVFLDTLTNDVFDGPGTDLTIADSNNRVSNNDPNNDFITQSFALFGGLQEAFLENTGSRTLLMDNIASHVTNQGLTSWTLIWFIGKRSGTEGATIYIDGNSYTPYTGSVDEGTLHAAIYDGAAGEFRLTMVSVGGAVSTTTVAGSATDLDSVNFAGETESEVYGEIAFFTEALTDSQLKTINDQRRFFGTISGTATVDGNGAAATIRAFTRVGGHLSGETTAASDGTYELYVRDPAEMDILAIPPAGVAARPLAHGPIVPIAAPVG